ncbi:MAG: copper-translocating P-type ATPase [Armatimonadota bacterium]|nr:copper-translocating P-type ATPase [Armatimonadota bacterium]MDR7468324.1 copper-translocating P-type ATPase [Armatimonadota bacterium]MDR7492627.1 copper-translocating P-type ATPase [Armatimonadota bacterium]MDR7500011.1 copper-translocating P-type ATPase [Armatimonadota bacterium]MDR7505892.1 copper-translocating P-type ATPase [Armatimonadota bacterium]
MTHHLPHHDHTGHETAAPPASAPPPLAPAICTCGTPCLSCEAARLAATCGCEFEAKQFEYAQARHAGQHRHHDAAHGMGEAHDHEAQIADPRTAAHMEADMRRRFWWSLALTIPAVLYSPLGRNLLGLRLPEPAPANWILLLLTTPVVFWTGSIFVAGAHRSLRRRTLNMSVLISTGVLTAYLFSVGITLLNAGETFYEAAAMLVTFVLFGHWMEMRSRRGTADALQALFSLVPPRARVVRDGSVVEVPSAEVRAGEIVELRPGDRVPVDGQVIQGETAVDESLVTGESLPVPKRPGDTVTGGTINQSGSIRFRATKVGADTALAQIIRLVEEAQASKAPGQRIADRWAQVLVILAVGAGVLTFLLWYGLAGESVLTALTFAISAVVIACPDALGLATPTAVAVGTGLGARHHILIKNAAALEQVSRITAVVLDKTGTLTEGRPRIVDVLGSGTVSPDDVVRLAASAEQRSGHPLSRAVLEEAARRGLGPDEEIAGFENLAGHGVEATVAGRRILVGTVRLMRDRGIDLSPVQATIDRLLAEGKTLMAVAADGAVVGVLAAADPIRESSRRAVAGLRRLGIEVAMITGDNQQTARRVGDELGIARIFAEVLPEQKADYVRRLQREGKFVAMVGDGVNDAPALAAADIGIAIGAGTDVAVETADVVLMRSDPADVLRAIFLSRATVRKMRQNLFWASIYNLLAIPIAAGALYPAYGILLRPEWSALLMSASSIVVAANAVLLKRAAGPMQSQGG